MDPQRPDGAKRFAPAAERNCAPIIEVAVNHCSALEVQVRISMSLFYFILAPVGATPTYALLVTLSRQEAVKIVAYTNTYHPGIQIAPHARKLNAPQSQSRLQVLKNILPPNGRVLAIAEGRQV